MFDTLPSKVNDWEQLKPGDMVFYEAEYTKPNMRSQRFGMVHVQIYTGGKTGEESQETFNGVTFARMECLNLSWSIPKLATWLGFEPFGSGIGSWLVSRC